MRVGADIAEEEEASVQMAPLIDCVFLLLIFFLVAATLKKAHNELEVVLPHTAAAIQPKAVYRATQIELARNGDILLEAEPVTAKILHQRLRALAVENPSQRIRIRADRGTVIQHIIHVLDLCQFEGLNNVSIRTRN